MRNLQFDSDSIREAIIRAILFNYIYLNQGSFKCNQMVNVYSTRKGKGNEYLDDEPSTSRKKTLTDTKPAKDSPIVRRLSKGSPKNKSKVSKSKMQKVSSTKQSPSNKSKRFKEESHLVFLQELQSSQSRVDSTTRRRRFLQQNEGKRDQDIMGITVPSTSTMEAPGSRADSKTKKQRSSKRVAYENNFVMTSYPNLLTLMKEKLHCGGDSLLNDKRWLDMMYKKKNSIFRNIFKRKRVMNESGEIIPDDNSDEEGSSIDMNMDWYDKCNEGNLTQKAIETMKNCIEIIRAQECEVKQAIEHYITDSTVFTKLQDTINTYIHFQIESERKAWKAVSELYDKEHEMKERQCEHLKTLVDSLIRENTRVRNKLDTLEQQNEFLLINLKTKQTNKRSTININDLILHLYKNNEVLRKRLRADVSHINYLQTRLKFLHETNINLSNSNTKLQIEISNRGLTMQRYQDQIKLETKLLRTELDLKTVLINECEKHKLELLQIMGHEKGQPLSDTLKTCKIFILSQLQQLTSRQQETNILKSEIQNLRNVLNNNSLSNSNNLQYIEKKVEIILNDYETFKTHTNNERIAIRCRMKAYKDEINTINRLNQSKVERLQSASDKLENDLKHAYEKNKQLENEIEQTKSKHKSMIQYQEQSYEYSLKLHDYLIEMKKINTNLQDSLNTANEKNLELKKHFDVCQPLPPTGLESETHLVRELEQTVNDLQVELTKLNLMQEYYKQLQDRHNEVLNERDKSINELNAKLIELKQQHAVDSNDKAMLCVEVDCMDKQIQKLNKELSDALNSARKAADEKPGNETIVGKLEEKYRLVEKERDALLIVCDELKVKGSILHEKLNKKC